MSYTDTETDALMSSVIGRTTAERLDFTATAADLHAASMRALAALTRFENTDYYPEGLTEDIARLLRQSASDINEIAGRTYTRLTG